MFKGAMSDEPVMDVDAENVGIMSGFKDILMDDSEDMDEDEMEMSQIMGRTPDSPEILMNNLRGDMRSLDARRDELADLVGYQAAEETPESVLAMLQPVLAAQGGIGALPQQGAMPPGPPPGMMPPTPPGGMPPPGMMPPDMGMPPPGAMPPGPPPEMAGGIGGLPAGGPPPMQMARGGLVQYFSQGSTRAAVSPADDAASDEETRVEYPDSVYARFPEALTQQSMARVMALMKRGPAAPVPSLESLGEEKTAAYRRILGSNKEALQGQAALDLARLFFSYAGNVDPETGKPMKGSPFARIAQTARALPTAVGKYGAEIAKEDRALKLAGLEAAEKDLAARVARDQRLQELQLGVDKEILRGQRATGAQSKGPFGSGLKNNAYNLAISLAPRYAEGQTLPDEDRQFESAYRILNEPDFVTGPKGDLVPMKPPPLPFLEKAYQARLTLGKGAAAATTGTTAGITPSARGETGVTQLQGPPGASAAAPTKPTKGEKPLTMLSLAGRATGPLNVTATTFERYGAGMFGDLQPGAMQADAFLNLAKNRIVNGLQQSPRWAEGERQMINRELDIIPTFLGDAVSYANRLVGIDDMLANMERNAINASNDGNIHVDERNNNANFARNIKDVRDLMGVRDLPVLDPTKPDLAKKTFDNLGIGDYYKRAVRTRDGTAYVVRQKLRE